MSKWARKLTLAVALVGVLALAVSACDSDDGGGTDSADIDPAAVLVYGDNLSGSGFSQRLQIEQMRQICDATYGNMIYSTLIRRDTKTNEAIPGLAESWKIVDARTFELKLRPNLTFQDGTKLDAAAAKAGLDKNRTAPSVHAPTMREIETVTAGADGLTVTLKLNVDAAAVMPMTLAGREGMIAAAASTDTQPLGAGPFKFVSQVVGSEMIFEKFDGYWDADNVQLAGVKVVHTVASSATTSLLGGDFDIVTSSPSQPSAFAGDDTIVIQSAPGGDYNKIDFNLTKAPLNNKALRQAINHAINREALLEVLFAGEGEVASQPFPSNFSNEYQEDLSDEYPYDPAKARQLLQSANLTNLALEAQTNANDPTYARMAEIIQAQLREVGIQLTVTPSTNLLASYYQAKGGNMILSVWPARPDPSVTIFRQFGANQVTNVGNYPNPGIDSALAKIRGSINEAGQAEGYEDAVEIVVGEALQVPLVFPNLVMAHQSYVVSDDWQIYGTCQGVDFSKLAVTVDKP